MYRYSVNNFLHNKNKNNNKNNKNTLNNYCFRQYITDTTNEYIQKKIDFSNKYPYDNLIIQQIRHPIKEQVPHNILYELLKFLSISTFLYYFYSRKH
jgi:hypothetical protein